MQPGTAYKVFYHLTRLEKIEKIMSEGIKPSRTGYVYLCDNEMDPFFMAPCGRAARTRFALSMIDKQPFIEQLALIKVYIPLSEAHKIKKLPFNWFEGIRRVDNKSQSLYQQYLYPGTISWTEDMSFEVYTFCDPEQLKQRLGLSGESIDNQVACTDKCNKDVWDLLEQIAKVLPC